MTVIRLSNGDLLLHSPTRFSPELGKQVEESGAIRHLIAPSFGHWMFVREWQSHYPDASTWAAPGLRQRTQVKKSGLRIDQELDDSPPPEWAEEVDQLLVRGGAGFREAALLHRSTRTLILTDLVVNVEPERLPVFIRPLAKLAGVVAPHGAAPIYLRAAIKLNRSEAKKAATQLIEWRPERVIFSHGRWFEENATERLERSLAWLL